MNAKELAKKINKDGSVKRSDSDHLFRFSRVDADSADDAKHTLQVAFASEEPVLRRATEGDELLGIADKGTKYWEVLSHRSGDYDLSELDGGKGDVLDEHDNSKQIGKVNRAKVSKDKISRAVLQFDFLSELSKTRFEQMKRGSRTGISTGYWHTGFVKDDGELDGYPVKRVQWASDEVSSVRQPADKNRSGVRRSADGKWSCIGCGEMFDRSVLSEDYECEDCVETTRAATPEEKLARAKSDEAKTISQNEMRNALSMALNNDKRFKAKMSNGDLRSDFTVHDIHQATGDGDDDEYSAIVSSPAWSGTYFTVDFEYDGKTVTLGDETEVEPKMTFEEVSRGKTIDELLHRSGNTTGLAEMQTRIQETAKKFGVKFTDEHSPLDSDILARESQAVEKLKRTEFMPDKTPEQIIAETEKRVRAEVEPQIRTAVDGEYKTRSSKILKRNGELKALADEFVKTRGANWAGKPGEVVIVGERIRSFENEFCAMDDSKPDHEIRSDFKAKCRELIDGSRAPKNQIGVAELPGEIANRCSLRNVYNSAALSKSESPCYMPKEGAEYEAHTEIHGRAKDFPNGQENLGSGLILPANMPSRINRNISGATARRLTRDSLAGDFSSVGALIAPEFEFPAIELLRNWPALSQVGMTILSGVMGPLVLPRQTSPTKSQSVAEGAILAENDQTFDQIKMSPKRVGSTQKYTRLAMLQPGQDFEALVLADHMAQNALRMDELGINGQGANDEPLGILNQIGIGSVTFGGSAANAFKNALAMETAIRAANIRDDISYLTTSTGRGALRSTARLLVGATTVPSVSVWEDGDTVNGRKAADSQQIPGDVLIAGAFRHLVCALWGGIAVVLDTISLADQDKYKLSINLYLDFALRHAQAIVRSSDSIASLS